MPPASAPASPIRLAISTGDPRGIGPQITRAVLQTPGLLTGATPLVFGTLDHTATLSEAHAGLASYRAVLEAIEAVKRGEADALVTAPISKAAWHAAGFTRHPGHTELLAEAFASPRSGMLFVGPSLRVMLATIHVPLARVPLVLTTERVLEAIGLTHQACLGLGVASPRIAVAGLNPHAGEGGLLGTEDDGLIAPAVAAARAAGINVAGPLSGDTVFNQAVINRTHSATSSRPQVAQFDAVVAMYHDQGLIPVKLLDGLQAVNVTVGLRWQGRAVIRTSPAHGTAFDIAGNPAGPNFGPTFGPTFGARTADPAGMVSAIALAIEMARHAATAQPAQLPAQPAHLPK